MVKGVALLVERDEEGVDPYVYFLRIQSRKYECVSRLLL